MPNDTNEWITTPLPGRNDEQDDFDEDDLFEGIEEGTREIDSFPTLDDDEDDFELEEENKEDDVDTEEEADDEEADDEEDTDSTDNNEVQDSSKDSQEAEDDSTERKEFGQRAQKRIQKLAQQKNEYRSEIENLRKELLAEKASKVEARKADTESKKQYLDEQVDTLTTNMREAMELGETDKFIDAQKKFQEVSMRRMALDAVKFEEVPSEEEYFKENPIQDNTPDVPEEAVKWIKKHESKFRNNPLAQQVALSFDEELKAEGWDDNSESYYTELDKRLGTQLVSFQTEEAKPLRKGKPKSARRSPVSGKAQVPVRRRADGLPALSQAEKQIAEELGISKKDYAKQKLKYDKAQGNAYVKIDK